MLADYDGLLIYGDHTAITSAEERALATFVDGGKGVVAINARRRDVPLVHGLRDLIGARLQHKATADFTAEMTFPPPTRSSRGCSRSRPPTTRSLSPDRTPPGARC